MGPLAFTLILMVWFIFPGLLLLQPFRLWRVTLMEKDAITPRQRFRGMCYFHSHKVLDSNNPTN